MSFLDLALISIALYGTASVVFLSLIATLRPSQPLRKQPSDEFGKGDESPTKRNASTTNADYVFIGIKTSEAGVHGQRLPQIQKTWLKDALQTKRIDIKFFTHIQVNETEDDSSLMVTTSCDRRNLPCKTGKVFAHYLEHSTASWFCSFDDDNYVLVDNLLQVLNSYLNGTTKEVYIGKSMGPGMFYERVNATVRHGTGGAGYCLSRHLVKRGKDYFTSLTETGLQDDIAVGYVVQEKLGVNITTDPFFHSHYERTIRDRIPKEEISKQVCFGRDNKGEYSKPPVDHMPNIPIIFSVEEDPLSFRSLWCFLHESERDSPDCKPNNMTNEE